MSFPSVIEGPAVAQRCGTPLMVPVSLDHELELHIEDCHWQYRTAYERFQLHGLGHDRDEALLHLHRMNVAILSRSPREQALRHAAFEQRLSYGIDYFQAEGQRARQAMQGACA